MADVAIRFDTKQAKREARALGNETGQLEAAVKRSQKALRGQANTAAIAAQATATMGRSAKAATPAVRGLAVALKAIPFLTAAEAARRFFTGFAEADKAAAAVRTLGVDSKRLKAELIGLSTELQGLVSQTELLKASYDVASAGFNTAADATNVLRAASKGAIGGLSDLNTVADATTSVLNAYGLSSDKAAALVDGFIQTQNDGKIVVAQYAAQIGRVAPIAAAAGVGIQELNAAISAVTASGVPVESTFAGLRQVIASIIKPTDEAKKVSEALGLEFNSAAIKAKGFGGFLADVVEKTGGSEVALTKLFGSVEAVAAILPLTNDRLVRFNTNVDNQKKSVGAADKAVKDLGGTVSAQVSSIVNNIGNAARALDTVLAPSLERILGTINSILTQANKALAAFSDVAVGDVNRALFDFSAGATTGSLGAPAFEALKKSVSQLNPALAQSEQDLDKYTRALSDVEVQLQRIGPNAGAGFLKLQKEVNQAISAQTNAILARKAALAQAGVKPAATETGAPDPNLDRVQQLLTQLDAAKGAGKGAGQFQLPGFAGTGIDPGLAAEQSFAKQVEQISEGNMLLQARLDGNEKEEQQRQAIANIIEQSGFVDKERIESAKALLQNVFDRKNGLEQELTASQKLEAQQKKAAQDLNRLYEGIGSSIKDGVVGAIKGAIDGTKSLKEVAVGLLNDISSKLLDFAVNMALFGVGSGFGSGGGLFGGLFKFGGGQAKGGPVSAGTSYVVGEKGPEMFTPSRSGRIIPNNQMGGVGSITVNVDATGTQVQGDQPNANKLGEALGAAVRAELIRQKRPGGLLA